MRYSPKYPSTMNNKKLTPFSATHPGELIKDELLARNITQKRLAELAGIAESVLSEIINGKRSISINTAIALERAIEIPADYWMNLQSQYDLDTSAIAVRDSKKATVTLTIPARDRRLLKEIAHKFGWACVF